MQHELDRRRFIALTGAAGVATLAGCTGDEEPAEEAPTDPDETEADETEADESETDEEDAELPDPTATDNALIEPATLKEWQDAGLVNMEETDGRERVVVLRVWDTEAYDDGHVPGAVPWGPDELHASRVEGLAEVAPLVATGGQMDDVLQRAGVCPATTIVLSGPNALRTARAYWTLRYWGFPRERVKVLNGGYYEYGEEYDLETGSFDDGDVPETGFTVEANEELNNDLRLGMAQMLQRVDLVTDGERDDVFLENRAPKPDAVIQGAIWDDPAVYHEGEEYHTRYDEGGRWKSATEIEAHVSTELGIDEDDTIVTYCGSGYRAAQSFFALDGVLGYDDVAVYDGSFSRQWAHYTESAEPTPNDAWRVDVDDRTDGPLPESDPSVVEIDPDLNEELTDLTAPEANQVEVADIEYVGGDAGGDADDGEEADGDWGCPSIPTLVP